MCIYTIYDLVAKEAGPLFLAKNDDVAARNYQNMLKANPGVYVDDYELRCIGTFNTVDCTISNDGYHLVEMRYDHETV